MSIMNSRRYKPCYYYVCTDISILWPKKQIIGVTVVGQTLPSHDKPDSTVARKTRGGSTILSLKHHNTIYMQPVVYQSMPNERLAYKNIDHSENSVNTQQATTHIW